MDLGEVNHMVLENWCQMFKTMLRIGTS